MRAQVDSATGTIYSDDFLSLKTLPELRGLMSTMGGRWAKTEKKTDLIPRLIAMAAVNPPDKKLEKPQRNRQPAAPVEPMTQEQVREIVARHPDLQLTFTDDDACWHLRGHGREDSGTMKMPVGVFTRIVGMLARQ